MGWRSTDAYGDYGDWSEDDVAVRPGRASRPRTKQRPAHENAIPGFVFAVDRGRYSVLVDEGSADERTVIAARARELGRKAVVTGDRVDLVGETSGEDGSLARIVRVQPRTTVLRRSADDSDQVERVIVANADQLCIVVAAADPEPRPRLIDRALVAAFDAGISPLLVITKTDLASSASLRELVDALDIPVFESSLPRPGDGAERDALAPLRAALAGHITVLLGHSGVGKSTLVNALVPEADRAIGHVNAVTGRGRHTSSSSLALRLDGPDGGWIVDTPGVRSFGLGHVDPDAVIRAFPRLAAIAAECPRGCTHLADAPDCELDAAIADGRLDASDARRLASLRRMLATL